MRDSACRGMGATIVAVRISGRRLGLAHVGDSRAYLFRADALEQLTSDHSLVAEQLVCHGLMTHQQAATSELQSVLTRALGMAETVEIDADEIELFRGDAPCCCSDGLTRTVPEPDNLEQSWRRLWMPHGCGAAVNVETNGGDDDNVTVIVIVGRSGWEAGWRNFSLGVARK